MSFLNIGFSSIGQVLLVELCLLLGHVSGHPASGIVVDARGNIYFIDSGHGVMKLDTKREMTVVQRFPDGHWLTIDEAGHFSRSTPKYFQRITPSGATPTLIFAGGGAPLVVAEDGALYYGSGESNADPMFPGGLTLSKILPDGRQMPVSERLREILRSWDDGITGVAAGYDQSVYAATWTGVVRVGFDGTATVVKHPISVAECDPDPADHKPDNKLPFLRGLAVLPDGTVYAAATSCHAVVKIGTHGDVRSVLKSERPWSPTGIAVYGHDLYVLEYTNANGPQTEGWRPRIRKIDGLGHVSTVVRVH
jgi:hypothetical protein